MDLGTIIGLVAGFGLIGWAMMMGSGILPFVDVLKRHADVMSLDADRDYRLDRLARTKLYVTPLGDAADRALDEVWARLTGGLPAHRELIAVKGREVVVPAAA